MQIFVVGVLLGFENYIVCDGVICFNYDFGIVSNMIVNQGVVLQVNGVFGISGNFVINGVFQVVEGMVICIINVGGNFFVGSNGILQVVVVGLQVDWINVVGSVMLVNGVILQLVVKIYVFNIVCWIIFLVVSGLLVDVLIIQLVDIVMLDYGL